LFSLLHKLQWDFYATEYDFYWWMYWIYSNDQLLWLYTCVCLLTSRCFLDNWKFYFSQWTFFYISFTITNFSLRDIFFVVSREQGKFLLSRIHQNFLSQFTFYLCNDDDDDDCVWLKRKDPYYMTCKRQMCWVINLICVLMKTTREISIFISADAWANDNDGIDKHILWMKIIAGVLRDYWFPSGMFPFTLFCFCVREGRWKRKFIEISILSSFWRVGRIFLLKENPAYNCACFVLSYHILLS
jgi:hypothetical protein